MAKNKYFIYYHFKYIKLLELYGWDKRPYVHYVYCVSDGDVQGRKNTNLP